jgi:uncharacterized protein YjbJ (UPF0337 family)
VGAALSSVSPRRFDSREVDMTWNRIESNWKHHAQRVKERWDKLSNEDLDTIGGEREKLEAHLRRAYGIQPEDARKEVDDFCRAFQAR